jgi:two-component system sensor histidine kinase UhpB
MAGSPALITPRRARPIPLFWRLFIPNAAVLVVACAFLIVAPPNGRVVILCSGLVLMLVTNLFLMRRAFAPLQRLFGLMPMIDPLAPGRRLPVAGPESEVTDLARAFNEMLDRLEAERRDSARRALAAQESERRRVAHELHDEVGQTLTAFMLELERLARTAPPDLKTEIEYLKRTASDGLDDVRRIARRLRPEALDDLGLASALISLVDRLEQATGMRIERRIDRGLPRLSPEAELVIYRIAQESLTNSARHSGASEVRLTLGLEGGAVRLVAEDDGSGFDPASLEHEGGIRGMRERAVLIGARLAIDSRAGAGTRVELSVDSQIEAG